MGVVLGVVRGVVRRVVRGVGVNGYSADGCQSFQLSLNLRLIGLLLWLSHFIMIRFGSLEKDYLLFKGDMTLEKDLRSQYGKDVQLHDSLGSPRSANELPTISASM